MVKRTGPCRLGVWSGISLGLDSKNVRKCMKREIPIKYIHGDVLWYPSMAIKLTVDESQDQMKICVALDLLYPVILGWDWKYFSEHLQKLPLMWEPEEDIREEMLGVLFRFKDPDVLTSQPKRKESQREKVDWKERVERERWERHNPSVGTASLVNTSNAEGAREVPSTGPNKVPPLQLDLEKLIFPCGSKKWDFEPGLWISSNDRWQRSGSPEGKAVPPFCP